MTNKTKSVESKTRQRTAMTSVTNTTHTTVGVVTKAGFKIYYAKDTETWAWWTSTYPGWESETFKVFRKLVKSDSPVIDVGAWIGSTSIFLAHLAPKVVSVEPSDRAFKQLVANINVNPKVKRKIALVNAALGMKDEQLHFSDNGDSKDRPVKTGGKVTQVISVATFLNTYPDAAAASFVKIDTEGGEFGIIPAFEQFFRTHRPSAYISLHECFIGPEKVKQVISLLRAIFPYLYEPDMKTPFGQGKTYTKKRLNARRSEVVATWEPLV